MIGVSKLLKDFSVEPGLSGDIASLATSLNELKGIADTVSGASDNINAGNQTAIQQLRDQKKIYNDKKFLETLSALLNKLGASQD